MLPITTLSEDRVFRYTLWREWGVQQVAQVKQGSFVMFVGLNPSTADEFQDDATIRKCKKFAARWGYERMCMMNLFAFRATKPKSLLEAQDRIGPDNDKWIKEVAPLAGMIVAAWGTYGTIQNRDTFVLPMLGPDVRCFRKNADGTPAHPLYQKDDSILAPYHR